MATSAIVWRSHCRAPALPARHCDQGRKTPTSGCAERGQIKPTMPEVEAGLFKWRQANGRKSRGAKSSRDFKRNLLVLRERIELSTSPLPMECSTTELPQQDRWALKRLAESREAIARAGVVPKRRPDATSSRPMQPGKLNQLAATAHQCGRAGRRRADGRSGPPGKAAGRRRRAGSGRRHRRPSPA